jgi:D-glycero-alpha-D-manno-heptose 1-phosphate guanylyltransferase
LPSIKSDNRPKEAIILAGGMGTRLQSVSGGLPKPMMPVCGKPFIEYLFRMMHDAGIKRTILSLGYKPEIFQEYLGTCFNGMSLTYCIEETPLGTGGALGRAIAYTEENNLVVLNGDSYINVDIADIFSYHVTEHGDITIALKYLDDCSRYGSVSTAGSRIIEFREKGFSGSGYINSGVYIVNRRIAEDIPIDSASSLETDFLAKRVGDYKMLSVISNRFFIDIGTPDDYLRAQREFIDLMDIEH